MIVIPLLNFQADLRSAEQSLPGELLPQHDKNSLQSRWTWSMECKLVSSHRKSNLDDAKRSRQNSDCFEGVKKWSRVPSRCCGTTVSGHWCNSVLLHLVHYWFVSSEFDGSRTDYMCVSLRSLRLVNRMDASFWLHQYQRKWRKHCFGIDPFGA